MMIRQWLKETVWPALKNAWNRSREKSRKKAASRILQNNDLANPLHPFNVEKRAMEDYNDRWAQESLRDYLQDTQRFEDRHRHDYW
jgi:hypothetical protein